MPIPSGTSFGAYEIVATLGAGGMGEVYRARDTRLARDVALKILPVARSDDPGFRARPRLFCARFHRADRASVPLFT